MSISIFEEKMKDTFISIQNELITYNKQSYSDFQPSDVRNTTFQIMLQQVRAYFIISYSLSIEHKDAEKQDYMIAEQRIRFDFFIALFSQFENSINLIIRSSFTTKQKKDNISDELYNGFHLAKELRNCIHNNGFYFPDNGNNNTINFNGKKFELLYGEGVDFLTWELVAELIVNLIKVLNQIFLMPSIKDIKNPIVDVCK